MTWRSNISGYQSKIVEDNQNNIFQQSIIPENDNIHNAKINPFSLQGLSLNFWRTNQFVHNGPAMYFVIDTIGSSQIISKLEVKPYWTGEIEFLIINLKLWKITKITFFNIRLFQRTIIFIMKKFTPFHYKLSLIHI